MSAESSFFQETFSDSMLTWPHVPLSSALEVHFTLILWLFDYELFPTTTTHHHLLEYIYYKWQAHSINSDKWMNEKQIFPKEFLLGFSTHVPQFNNNEAFVIKIITIFPDLKLWWLFKSVTFIHLQVPAICLVLWIVPLECLPCLMGIPLANP